jgi:hypothetical protein
VFFPRFLVSGALITSLSKLELINSRSVQANNNGQKAASGVLPLVKPESAQTAVDLLILTLLEPRGPPNGDAITTAIEELSREALRVEEAGGIVFGRRSKEHCNMVAVPAAACANSD